MLSLAVGKQSMQMAPQEVRTFFVGAVAWGRRSIFHAEPMARLFLDVLRHYRMQHRYLLHEFVLMPDHFHLLLTPMPDISLEKAAQLIKGGFSFRVKHEMGSNLEVWQPGFTNHRIHDAGDYARHVEYIRENPVKRHLVARAEDYPYSSAAGALEADPAPPGLKAPIMRAVSSSVPRGGTDASTGVNTGSCEITECPTSNRKMQKLYNEAQPQGRASLCLRFSARNLVEELRHATELLKALLDEFGGGELAQLGHTVLGTIDIGRPQPRTQITQRQF